MNDKLEEIKWHLARNDQRREFIASRSAIILSADAILFAAGTFSVDKVVELPSDKLSFWFYGMLIVILLSLLLSMFYAIQGIMSLRSRKNSFDANPGASRLFFHEYDTVQNIENKNVELTLAKKTEEGVNMKRSESNLEQIFHDTFMKADTEELLKYGTATLWLGLNHFRRRYRKLRWSIIYLFSACVLTFAFIFIMIVQKVI